ncbi:MAG: fructose-bisphosphate aldolase class I [Flavobacteriales bacterium]|nr:fructose-bisphosphate aldolase class I [Flavobacteriales bacterium]|tara:strand:+ start:32248 stop:33240 length:993 start_codon:yes stop_codon:yes gene_type:complete
MENLKKIAQKMVADGKGILAADESTPTCSNRFKSVGVESTEESRNNYRSLLFSTKNLNKYISGVILFQETFNQKQKSTNQTIPDYLKNNNILSGIKLDTGAKILANHSPEKITEGLDGLREKIIEYRSKGASFAKWRAVITIGKDIPTPTCISANCHALARYASLCQENGLVPIVEPEVLMNGEHTAEKCQKISNDTLKTLFHQLELFKVDLEAIILKPNMILPGDKSNQKISNKDIAKLTFDVLYKNVPPTVPGIAFLSGGQSSDNATKRLNELNKLYNNHKPWSLTFSYGRALQEDALKEWANKNEKKAQDALIYRAEKNHFASLGEI